MPRHNHPRSRRAPDQSAARPMSGSLGWAHTESGADGEWLVRHIPAASATKVYRCPGCDHEIQPGVPHVVAWPAEEHGSVGDRRHWHTGCWSARGRRGPTSRRW